MNNKVSFRLPEPELQHLISYSLPNESLSNTARRLLFSLLGGSFAPVPTVDTAPVPTVDTAPVPTVALDLIRSLQERFEDFVRRQHQRTDWYSGLEHLFEGLSCPLKRTRYPGFSPGDRVRIKPPLRDKKGKESGRLTDRPARFDSVEGEVWFVEESPFVVKLDSGEFVEAFMSELEPLSEEVPQEPPVTPPGILESEEVPQEPPVTPPGILESEEVPQESAVFQASTQDSDFVERPGAASEMAETLSAKEVSCILSCSVQRVGKMSSLELGLYGLERVGGRPAKYRRVVLDKVSENG